MSQSMRNTKLNSIVDIDGAQGEGGGQIFRTALTLSMCHGIPVRIVNIRQGRAKPGLLRQHLTCLRAAAEICDAAVSGDQLGSAEVLFIPSRVKAGCYHFSVGSAGSTTLVFQTILMPLLMAGAVSEVTFEGGTHNGMSPSFDYLQDCFIPILRQLGCQLELDLQQYGFYPRGGGLWRARVHPVGVMNPLSLVQAGEILERRAVAISAGLPANVTERELRRVGAVSGWSQEDLQQRLVESIGPGNLMALRIQRPQVAAMFEAVGERRVSAERVAHRALSAMERYLKADVPVEEHLADQLILPMVLGYGGCFVTSAPTLHLLTNIAVVDQFLGVKVALEQLDELRWQVSLT